MTIRDGRRELHDHGPAPLASNRIPGGSIAVPQPSGYIPHPRPRTFDANEWKRMKRATDPAWAARERERDAARRRRAA